MGKGKKKSPSPNNGRAKSPGAVQTSIMNHLTKKSGEKGHRGASNGKANNKGNPQPSTKSSPTNTAGKGSVAAAAQLSRSGFSKVQHGDGFSKNEHEDAKQAAARELGTDPIEDPDHWESKTNASEKGQGWQQVQPRPRRVSESPKGSPTEFVADQPTGVARPAASKPQETPKVPGAQSVSSRFVNQNVYASLAEADQKPAAKSTSTEHAATQGKTSKIAIGSEEVAAARRQQKQKQKNTNTNRTPTPPSTSHNHQTPKHTNNNQNHRAPTPILNNRASKLSATHEQMETTESVHQDEENTPMELEQRNSKRTVPSPHQAASQTKLKIHAKSAEPAAEVPMEMTFGSVTADSMEVTVDPVNESAGAIASVVADPSHVHSGSTQEASGAASAPVPSGTAKKAPPPTRSPVYRGNTFVSNLENGTREDIRPRWLDLETGPPPEPALPPIGEMLPERPNLMRVDVRFEVPECESGEAYMQDLVKHMFQQAQSVDPTVTFYPWEKQHAIGPRPRFPSITSLDEFPSLFSSLQRYMPKMWFPRRISNRWTLHTAIWIGSTMPWQEIEENIRSWLSNNQIRWFERSLQVENTEFVGWFLYSTDSMDASHLQNALNKKLNPFQVEVRRRLITTSPVDMRDTEQEHQLSSDTRALYVVAEESCKQQVLKKLQEIYSTSATDFPLGYKLRIIPEFKGLVDKKSQDKFKVASHRQKSFQSRMLPLVNRALKVVTPEIRDMLMQLRSPSSPQDPLFHSVDFVRGNDPRAILVVHPDDESVAWEIHSGIIPFLRHQYRPKMRSRGDYWPTVAPLSKEEHAFMEKEIYRKWFKPEAVDKFLMIDWDPVKQCCVTTEASVLEETVEADSRFDFPETTSDEAPSNSQTMSRVIDSVPLARPPTLPPPAEYRRNFGSNDSISTFGTGRSGRQQARGPSPNQSTASGSSNRHGQASIVSRSATSNDSINSRGRSRSQSRQRSSSRSRDHGSAAPPNPNEERLLAEIRKIEEAHKKKLKQDKEAHGKRVEVLRKQLEATRPSEATEDGSEP